MHVADLTRPLGVVPREEPSLFWTTGPPTCNAGLLVVVSFSRGVVKYSALVLSVGTSRSDAAHLALKDRGAAAAQELVDVAVELVRAALGHRR
jgi:hypothetical protein